MTHSVPTAFIRGDECSGYGMGHARVTEVGKSYCCISFFFFSFFLGGGGGYME